MARRKSYTRVLKDNQLRAEHVIGMGDKTFRGFQCLNYECTSFLFILEDDIDEDFSIICPDCGYIIENGDATRFYEYSLEKLDPETKQVEEVIEVGDFEIDHFDYVNESGKFKYCIICNTLKPLDYFDKHASRKSGHQGECRLCKLKYNAIKNQTRISDQHREATQKRRLYIDLAGSSGKINTSTIFPRFGNKCFKCNEPLVDTTGKPLSEKFHLDHTLPAYYLWPLTTDNATLLCSKHNGEKSGKWPRDFYTEPELRKLSALTGVDYELMIGEPCINPEALEKLSQPEEVMKLMEKYGGRYMEELIKFRNRVLTVSGLDFFETIRGQISEKWIDEANSRLDERS